MRKIRLENINLMTIAYRLIIATGLIVTIAYIQKRTDILFPIITMIIIVITAEITQAIIIEDAIKRNKEMEN